MRPVIPASIFAVKQFHNMINRCETTDRFDDLPGMKLRVVDALECGIEFETTLASPILIALMYETLRDCVSVSELMSIGMIHIILNFIRILARKNKCHEQKELEIVGLETFLEFTNRIRSLSFSELMWTRFELQYLNSLALSFVDLISRIGKLGLDSLKELEIGFVNESPEQGSDRRTRPRLLREQIAQDFRKFTK